MSRFIVFGASGALGKATADLLTSEGHDVVTAGRNAGPRCEISTSNPEWANEVVYHGTFDGIVWAQGVNSSGTIISSSADELIAALEANVLFIQRTLQQLFHANAISEQCRSVVISSMWQEHARANKFAYLVSKAALSGLVKSVAIDMAEYGFSINAVLPGVIDTPMTRANLSSEQIIHVEKATLGGKLAVPENVAQAISWLLSPNSAGVTSQFITVDNGWTIHRNV